MNVLAQFQKDDGLESLRLGRASVAALEHRFKERLEVNPALSRFVVSFQANRVEPIFRWFKYREGFSRQLIEYVFDHVSIPAGRFVDPFAGTGVAAFVAADRGMDSAAIELLPVGSFFMKARQYLRNSTHDELHGHLSKALQERPWKNARADWDFPHLAITRGAFPDETEHAISQYKTWVKSQAEEASILFDFALFSILEEISFTRKDGQYLRWDGRAKRARGSSTFDKGEIRDFDVALTSKLRQMLEDLEAPQPKDFLGGRGDRPHVPVETLTGSVFDRVPLLADDSVACVMTSPPYCNRYDYTRTYALELAYLGVGEDDIRQLRQALLTCTVENKPKDFSAIDPGDLASGLAAFDAEPCLKDVLHYLASEKEGGRLNNDGILRMAQGYFLDTAIHLAQMARKMKRGGAYIMVNDNVRYNGLDIPVDCILSSIAENLGFVCEKIWVLPKGKGNSSQQMKKHGRSELRKCVYVWRFAGQI